GGQVMKVIESIDMNTLGNAILDVLDTGKRHLFQYLQGIGYIDAYVSYENLLPIVDMARIAYDGVFYPLGEPARQELNSRLQEWYLN
ncbi:MAG: hypothetical protein J5733_05560, partial [Bacteroidaceae bacterium]|nr:hypothetical protein [Bacteroidaceae bacterium]